MLKRILVSDLRVGMHVHELGGTWLDHPFWRSSFRIEDRGTIDKILASGIREAWIDTDKGLDLDGGVSAAEAEAEIERDLRTTTIDTALSASTPSITPDTRLADELIEAKEVCLQAVAEVGKLFEEVRLGRAIQFDVLMPVAARVAASVERNPGVLTALLRLRSQDAYTYAHSVAAGALMVGLAQQLGLEAAQLPEVALAGLLHDIGKVTIPPELLNKSGRLTAEEDEQLRQHALSGCRVLTRDKASPIAIEVARHHHERADGSGYPDGLSGHAINLYARMGTVCDVYDAVTSNRPYKAAWQPAHALRKMAEWSRTQYDARIFHAFVRTVGIYPIGTLVHLKSGHLGVVVEQHDTTLLKPRVKIFYAIDAAQRIPPVIVDLGKDDDEILSHEDPVAWGIVDLQELWSGLNGPLV